MYTAVMHMQFVHSLKINVPISPICNSIQEFPLVIKTLKISSNILGLAECECTILFILNVPYCVLTTIKHI